jgi:hypothetical protein
MRRLAHTRRPGRAVRAAAAVLLAAAAAGGAAAQGAGVLARACPGPGAAELLLLPEDAGRVESAPPGSVIVTGAYTATDTRSEGLPKPVGLYLRNGALVSLEFGRMDGILVVAADGAARIAAAGRVPLAGRRHDLRSLDGRRAFARAAGEAGASALQSHLLIRDGALDLRPVEGAPVAERRLLFQTREGGLGLWQSGGRALTLHEAAQELQRRHGPVMALNLDMGGHDFCLRRSEAGERACGRIGRDGLARLSNLIRLRADGPACP